MNTKYKWIPFLLILPLALLALCVGLRAEARTQGRGQEPKSIFDYFALPGLGRGMVVVHQSDFIRTLVGKRIGASGAPEIVAGSGEYAQMRGYRVQIYSGNRANSKAIAMERERQIRALEPELPTYVEYEAPFWKLRVGDYLTSQEAQEGLARLRPLFPSFSREMYVVRDLVSIPKY